MNTRFSVALTAAIFIAAAVPSYSQVSLTGNILTVHTDDLTAVFQAAALVSLTNRGTGEQYIAQPGSSWFSLNLLDPINQAMSAGTWTLAQDPATHSTVGVITYTDPTREATLTVGIDPQTNEFFLRVKGNSSVPGVESVFWGMFGFNFDEPAKLIIPGQAGEYFSRNSATPFIGLDYPTHWESQFVVYQAAKGSLLLYANDTLPHFKRLQASRLSGNLDFGFEMFALAPWPDATATPEMEWRMKGFSGDWKAATSYYKKWWTGAGPKNDVPSPEWVKDIRATVTILYLDQPALQALAQIVDPARTLLYVVPWRASGYDINYPDYTPSYGTSDYIELAHKLGFRVMLHTSALGVSETNPAFSAMQAHQLKTADSLEPSGWPLNLDPGDIHRIAYISPTFDKYRELLIDSLRPAIESLHPDAIHLDAGGTIINDGNGLLNGQNTIQGMVQLQKDLKAAFPGLALGYESITEINSPFIDFAQRWSEDVSPHPVSTYLFGDKVKFYGFLDQPNPQEQAFVDYLKHYEGQGILPNVKISSVVDFDPSKTLVMRTLKQLRIWQDRDFVPDWDNDWNGALFQYRSNVDGGTARLEQDAAQITLKIDDDAFYRRVINSYRFQTDAFIPNWPAYDDHSISGLNPNSQYWLETQPRPAGRTHLSDLSPQIRVDATGFVGTDSALFSLATNDPPPFDFVANFTTAIKGTMYLDPFRDRGLLFGALSVITPVFVGGDASGATLVMAPPYRAGWGGVTYVEYTVPLPDTQLVQFSFQVALPDSLLRKDPATFVVWVDGKEVWREYVGSGSWVPGSVDLSSYRGQTIKLRLIGGPGPHNNPIYAYTSWSKLAISTNPTRPGSQFLLTVPSSATPSFVGATAVSVSSPADGTGTTETTSQYKVTMDVPGSMLVFLKPPAILHSGDNLLDVPYTKFSSAYGSLPQPYVNDSNGVIIRNPGLGGATISRAIFTNPEHEGRIYLTWTATLPPNASTLDFHYGLMDTSPSYGNVPIPYSGIDLLVFINGEQKFLQHIQSAGAFDGTVDVSGYSGKPVLIQFAVDADGTAIYDWSLLSDLVIRGNVNQNRYLYRNRGR